MNDKKVFLIINSYYIGDMILVNSLVQNIKNLYPGSIVVMLSSQGLKDIAEYQYGVDDVIIWDRHGKHKGVKNMFDFIKKFPYKNIYAAFPIYTTDRPTILAKLLGAKYLLGCKRNILSSILLKSKYKVTSDYNKNTQKANMNLLTGITKKTLIDLPIKFDVSGTDTPIIQEIKAMKDNFIVLCPKSSKISKDMSDETVCELIEKFSSKIVVLGNGESSNKLSGILNKHKHPNVINLINKTSIMESAKIVSLSDGCISVDTGMLHISCALNIPVVGVFYNTDITPFWADTNIYPKTKCLNFNNTDEIIAAIKSLKEQNSNKISV